jgi:hypothetical protein
MEILRQLVAYARDEVPFDGLATIQDICQRTDVNPNVVVFHILQWLHKRGRSSIKPPLVLRDDAWCLSLAEVIRTLPDLDGLFATADMKVRFRPEIALEAQDAIEQYVAKEFPIRVIV